MKKIGIIGGAGPFASAYFYETFLKECYAHSLPIPEIFLLNFPFTRGLTIDEGKSNHDSIKKELFFCVESLAKHAIEIGIVICNTLHHYLVQSPIPFLSIPFEVLKEAQANGHTQLLLLATQNTCQSHLYYNKEISLIFPNQEEQGIVDQVIDQVLEGKIKKENSLILSETIKKISQREYLDGVILGCTDLPVLHSYFPIDSDLCLYDSIKIPAKALRGIL